MFAEQTNSKHEFLLFSPISSSTVHKTAYSLVGTRYKLLVDQNCPKIPFEYFKPEKKKLEFRECRQF